MMHEHFFGLLFAYFSIDFKFVGIKRMGICYSIEVFEMVVNHSLTRIKCQSYIRILLSHYERILKLSLMFMTSYLLNKSARSPNILDNDHKQYSDNFGRKSENRKFHQVVGFPIERLIYFHFEFCV